MAASEIRMTRCSENLHRVIVDGHPGDRQLDLNLSHFKAELDFRGAQIDAVIALPMAAEIAEQRQQRSGRVLGLGLRDQHDHEHHAERDSERE
jgi:hypothetical protein